MAVDYGWDISCLDDLDDVGRLVTGAELIRQAIYRRLTTPRGGVIDAPDYGYDLSALLSRGMTSADIAAVPGKVRGEILKDERVEAVDVVATMRDPATMHLTIRATTGAGPFELVLDVTAAAAKLSKLEA
jgi:phage baseplate assembly protein W